MGWPRKGSEMIESVKTCVAIEVGRDNYDLIVNSLETLEDAGVDIVRLRAGPDGEPAGPLFPIYGSDGTGPLKYVFYIRVPPGRTNSNGIE